jgi:hypothetical protein
MDSYKKLKKAELIDHMIKLQLDYDKILIEKAISENLVEEYKEMLVFLVPGFISYRDQLAALHGLLQKAAGAISSNDELVSNYFKTFGTNNLFSQEKDKFEMLIKQYLNKNIKKDDDDAWRFMGDDSTIN